MNAKAQPLAAAEPIDEAGAELAVIPRETALAVLTDPDQFDAFYARVKATTDAFVPDLSTVTSRKAIASMARKVVTSKTMIDNAGKLLTEEWRSQTKVVDDNRRAIREKLDALRDEVRRPLTDWEAAEEARVEDVKAQVASLQAAAVVSIEDTPETVQARHSEVRLVEISDDYFGEYAAAARHYQAAALASLDAAFARLTKEAADRAELERLRQEAAAREEADRAAREEQQRAEAAATAARIAAEAEERRKADDAARAQREQAERERAAADAQAEAERKAQATLAAAEEAHKAELARIQREADEANERRAAEERRAAAEAKRVDDEQAARDANQKHRSTVMAAAKSALMAAGGIGEDAAKKIVLAIRAGEIPSVTLRF